MAAAMIILFLLANDLRCSHGVGFFLCRASMVNSKSLYLVRRFAESTTSVRWDVMF